jgi:hypothetical protein
LRQFGLAFYGEQAKSQGGWQTVLILRAAAPFNPLVNGCLFEAQIATQLEVRNLTLLDKPINSAQVAVEVIGNHPGGEDLIAAVAAIFP